jgi:hypothetical protein
MTTYYSCPKCTRYEAKRARLDLIIARAKAARRRASGLADKLAAFRREDRLERARGLFLRAIFKAQDAHDCDLVVYVDGR